MLNPLGIFLISNPEIISIKGTSVQPKYLPTNEITFVTGQSITSNTSFDTRWLSLNKPVVKLSSTVDSNVPLLTGFYTFDLFFKLFRGDSIALNGVNQECSFSLLNKIISNFRNNGEELVYVIGDNTRQVAQLRSQVGKLNMTFVGLTASNNSTEVERSKLLQIGLLDLKEKLKMHRDILLIVDHDVKNDLYQVLKVMTGNFENYSLTSIILSNSSAFKTNHSIEMTGEFKYRRGNQVVFSDFISTNSFIKYPKFMKRNLANLRESAVIM